MYGKPGGTELPKPALQVGLFYHKRRARATCAPCNAGQNRLFLTVTGNAAAA